MYTRHKPQVVDVLDQLIKGKLKEAQFPYSGDYRLTDRYMLHVHEILYRMNMTMLLFTVHCVYMSAYIVQSVKVTII